jgi:hypothetical protein
VEKQVLLDLETTLRLRIVCLEWEMAQLQVRLHSYDQAEQLRLAGERHHHQTAELLGHLALPVPLSACTFDAEQGCLRYEEAEAEAEAGVPMPVVPFIRAAN